jgi:hypothetical protein
MKDFENLKFLRNPVDFFSDDNVRLKYGILNVLNKLFQSLICFLNFRKFLNNIFPQICPLFMQFFDLVNDENEMRFVFFRATLHAKVRMALIVWAGLLEAYKHYF